MKKLLIVICFSIVSICSYAKCSISNAGIEHIKAYEKCVLTAYWDSNGYSIGWGHHGSDVKNGMKISQSKANALLSKDIKEAEKWANWLISKLPYNYEFSQSFFDGLVDLVYNCGIGNVKSSIFYKRLTNCRVKNAKMNKSDYDFTIASVKNLNITARGHVSRRKATYKMMMSL